MNLQDRFKPPKNLRSLGTIISGEDHSGGLLEFLLGPAPLINHKGKPACPFSDLTAQLEIAGEHNAMRRGVSGIALLHEIPKLPRYEIDPLPPRWLAGDDVRR